MPLMLLRRIRAPTPPPNAEIISSGFIAKGEGKSAYREVGFVSEAFAGGRRKKGAKRNCTMGGTASERGSGGDCGQARFSSWQEIELRREWERRLGGGTEG